MSKILSKNIYLGKMKKYDHQLLKALAWFKDNRGEDSDEYKNKRKEVIKAIGQLLIDAGFTSHEAFERIKRWIEQEKDIEKQYNLSFGKYLENLVSYLLETNGITVTFPNGSKECEISEDMSKCKWFDISLTIKGLSGAADVKNGTPWAQVPENLPGDKDKWIYNTGLTIPKLEDIKEWGTEAHKKPFLILCIPEFEGDLLDQIIIVHVGKLIKNGKVIVDNERVAMHPNGSKWNKPGLVLFYAEPDGETVISLRDLINKYGKQMKGEEV